MDVYTPDCWELVKITNDAGESHYRVIAGWFGGYTGSDSWKLSSGILSATLKDDVYVFPQFSGSTYVGHKSIRRLNSMTARILQSYAESGLNIELCKEDPLTLVYT